jgi:hypothetical protein
VFLGKNIKNTSKLAGSLKIFIPDLTKMNRALNKKQSANGFPLHQTTGIHYEFLSF